MQRLPISLCMIVKDEEEHLPRCLKSLEGIVDEMIVVDTGSTDRTIAIAESCGAKVIRLPWRNDFAYARNAGLDAASGFWILFLDADEEIDAADREKLLICAQHPEYAGFLLNIHNIIGDGFQGASINPVLRMFRSAPEHRFEGRIHEQIGASIYRNNPSAPLHMSGIKLLHYGYKNEVVLKKDKVNRNLQLLRESLEESPDDPFHLYNIGIEYLRSGHTELALSSFRKSRSHATPALSYTHLLYKCEARCLHILRRTEEAIAVCDEGIAVYPPYTDLVHTKGIFEMELGRINDARTTLLAAYRLGSPPEGFHTEEGIGTYQTCYSLGLLHEAMDDCTATIRWYVEAVQRKPSLIPPLCRLFRFMKCKGLERDVPALFDRQLTVTSPEAAVKVVRLLLASGCRQAADKLLGRWKKLLPGRTWSELRFRISLLAGDIGEMRRISRKAPAAQRSADAASSTDMSGWLAWANDTASRRQLPDSAGSEQFADAVLAAAALGSATAALPVASDWSLRLQSAETADERSVRQLARALVQLADAQLEQTDSRSDIADLLLASRLAAPVEDGF